MSAAAKKIAYASSLLADLMLGEAAACSLADIKVEHAEVIVQSRAIYVSGRLANDCPEETGAQIRLTLRNDQGKVVFAGDFWPATRSIPPRNAAAFTYVLSPAEPSPDDRPSDIEVKIVGLRKW